MELAQRWVLVLILIAVLSINNAMGKSKYTAMYVFGDSMSDPGNNKFYKPNFWPYGVDYPQGPTGRFCNGKLIVDILGELLGFNKIPAQLDTIEKGEDILSGVNYASAGAGILEDTGYLYGRIIPFGEQVNNFKITKKQLENQMEKEELSNYLANALAFVSLGVNDYLNNYDVPLFYRSSHTYNPQEYADLLIELFNGHILELQSLGLRKFFIGDVPPLGCAPFVLKNGECQSKPNQLAQMYNSRLRSLVIRLNAHNPGSTFIYGASYEIFTDLRENANTYGFKVTDKACCGNGMQRGGKHICAPTTVPCYNRDEYLFWDFAHLTQAANRIVTNLVYNGTCKSCFPVNIQQLGEI